MALKALITTAAVIVAGAAQAAGPGYLGPINNGTVAIESTPSGAFADVYWFSAGSSGFAEGFIGPTSGPVSISAVGLFDSTNALLSIDTNGSDGFVTTAALPSAGLYYFGVVGAADGGSYTGGVGTLLTPAVPEPETYAMLLAGLVVVGAAATRRRKQA